MQTHDIALLACLVATVAGCEQKQQKKVSPEPAPRSEPAPARPALDAAFLARALGPGTALSNKAVLSELDPKPGTEALVAVHRAGKRHEVAVLRGNGEVLSRTPLGGKILANANIQAVGEFRRLALWKDGGDTFLMPVETLVHDRAVCGLVALRYREGVLSVGGEFATVCWREESSGHGGDPFRDFKVIRDQAGKLARVETIDDRGPRVYTWDPGRQTFRAGKTDMPNEPIDKPSVKAPVRAKP